MIANSFDDKMRNLKARLERLVNGNYHAAKSETTTAEELCKFGLSLSQAKAWLKREPKYPTDEILQGHKADEDFTEPETRFCKVCVCLISLSKVVC